MTSFTQEKYSSRWNRTYLTASVLGAGEIGKIWTIQLYLCTNMTTYKSVLLLFLDCCGQTRVMWCSWLIECIWSSSKLKHHKGPLFGMAWNQKRHHFPCRSSGVLLTFAGVWKHPYLGCHSQQCWFACKPSKKKEPMTYSCICYLANLCCNTRVWN